MARSRPVAYRQLADGLRARLREGEWDDGSTLPTELDLASGHGVSRQMVRRAMQELVAEGAIYRVPGRSTFAATGTRSHLRQFGSVDDLMGLSQDTELEVVAPLRRVDDPGTEEQRRAYLPRMATGEVRGAFSMSEPGLGSDVAAIATIGCRSTGFWARRPERASTR